MASGVAGGMAEAEGVVDAEGKMETALDDRLGPEELAQAEPGWSERVAAAARSKAVAIQSQLAYAEGRARRVGGIDKGATGMRCLVRPSKPLIVMSGAAIAGFLWVFALASVLGALDPTVQITVHQGSMHEIIVPGDVLEGSGAAAGWESRKSEPSHFEVFNPIAPRTPLEGLPAKFDPMKVTPVPQTRWPIKVAIFRGHGASIRSWHNIKNILKCANGTIEATVIKNANMATLNRENYDVFLVPGGESGKMNEWHTKHGSSLRKTVRTFVRSGGGYVGFCAGAYLGRGVFAMTPYRKASSMLGVGWFSDVVVEPDFEASAIFPVSAATFNENRMYYANGPIFQETPTSPLPAEMANPRVLMRLGPKASVHIEHGPVPGTKAHTIRHKFAGLPIVTYNEFSRGKVLLSTGHPETNVTKGIHSYEVSSTECYSNNAHLIINMVLMAANRTAVPESL